MIFTIESEYDTAFVIEPELQTNLLEKLNPIQSNPGEHHKNTNIIQEILAIANKLKLEDKDLDRFLGKILAVNQIDTKNQSHLKILYFTIVNEIERLVKIKTRAEKTASFRVTFLLLLLLSILIAQTGVFYHMIFNVDYLGWDLVEPATFLLSSSLFLIGVFSYVKLHRNAISGEKLFSEMTKSILTRRYIKTNFNENRYNDLKNQLELVNRLLKESKRI
jgi:hypothetical protein